MLGILLYVSSNKIQKKQNKDDFGFKIFFYLEFDIWMI